MLYRVTRRCRRAHTRFYCLPQKGVSRGNPGSVGLYPAGPHYLGAQRSCRRGGGGALAPAKKILNACDLGVPKLGKGWPQGLGQMALSWAQKALEGGGGVLGWAERRFAGVYP